MLVVVNKRCIFNRAVNVIICNELLRVQLRLQGDVLHCRALQAEITE